MKRWKERNGRIYARFTYTDSTGRRREVWEQATSKSDAKEKARKLVVSPAVCESCTAKDY